MYLMLLGSFPFRAKSQKELYVKIQKARFYLPDPASPILSPHARLVIKRLLKADAVSNILFQCQHVVVTNRSDRALAVFVRLRHVNIASRTNAWMLTSSVLTPG